MGAVILLCVLLGALTPPVGAYMYRVYTRPEIGRIEGFIYRLLRVDPNAEQSWKRYASCTLWFSGIAMVVTYLVFRFQAHLPLNPDHLSAVDTNVSFNTAASFT